MNISQCRKPLATIVLAVLGTVGMQSMTYAAVTIDINDVDESGVGFKDTTSVAPVGGNTATTLGDQRLAVLEEAAAIWGAILTSNERIIVQATFSPLACDASSAVLGSAGAIQIFADTADEPVPGLLYPNTWYHVALANKVTNIDQAPNTDDDGLDDGLLVEPFGDDIVAFFNGGINGDPNCLGSASWYYGFDHIIGANQIDLLNVVMHEFAHGLGFANFIDDETGDAILNLADIYSVFLRDNTSGKHWNQMTAGERVDSAVNTGNLIWDGQAVTAQAGTELSGLELIRADAGFGPDDGIEYQDAEFGPAATSGDVTHEVVLIQDAGRRSRTDGCESIAADLTGFIALIDRGNCNFTVKTANAEAAGAEAVLIANNVGDAIALGGDDGTLTIPTLGIGLDDGNKLKEELALGAVNLTGFFTSATLLAGVDEFGFVRLYAPNPAEPGSSVSHFDTVASPNLLMEPFISDDLTSSTDQDLTNFQFMDIGWDGASSCPIDTDDNMVDDVMIDGCPTGVANVLGPFQINTAPGRRARSSDFMNGGCYLADLYNACGTDAECLETTTDLLLAADNLTAQQASDISACIPGGPGGGFCPLGQPGDSCLVNNDCCSNKCKGKPGSMTCK